MKICTSYLAMSNKLKAKNILPVAIVRYLPRNLEMDNIIKLSPNPRLLSKYKNDSDSSFYTLKFNEMLETLDVKEVIEQLNTISKNNGNCDIALVCYERSEDFCHRHLVANWINNSMLLNYEVEEYRL